MITLQQLQDIMPRMAKNPNDSATYLPFLNAAMDEAQINTKLRIAAFLAQVAHESGQLRYMQEIASGEAYEGRKDLGNTQPGDGPRYKGRGPIQLTGRANYRACGQALGVDLENHPELAADPSYAFRVAGWFWTSKRLNALADVPNFKEITHRINGGYLGEEDREAFYQKALSVLP